MNRLRRSIYHRLLALVALVGIGAWVSAPLAVNPQASAAQMVRTLVGGPLGAALTEAATVASQEEGEDATQVFQDALVAALEAHPDGQALAEALAEHSPESLLDLLASQLFGNQPGQSPLMVVPTSAQSASASVGGHGLLVTGEAKKRPATSGSVEISGGAMSPPVSIWTLFAAQPLGP